ncbi:hypothetical protein [Helicobacter typhlonius]|uniref:hypothetical protein n=1 Tax=Helicobacter typhlonius TaxID=76936 RepID=UPI002FE0399A
MKFYDYTNATLVRKVFRFPLVQKNNLHSLIVFKFPLIIQKKTYRNAYNATGGGG